MPPGALDLNTPVAPLPHGDEFSLVKKPVDSGLQSIEDAIAVATSTVGLMPGAAFQARVAQLIQLSAVHRTVSSQP